jgi:pimeloyl-ACP methyl ester carboxylesterase
MPDVGRSGVRIHYEVDGDGPPLVLHHGLGGSGDDFTEVGNVEELRSVRRLVRIDARGHGRSDKPHERESYSPERMAGEVVAVLDDLGLEQADFFGYSMGGIVAFAVAKYAPERINSYAIGGASPYPPPDDTVRVMWAGLKGGPDAFVGFLQHDGPLPPGLGARARENDFDALRAYFTSPGVAPDPLDDVPPTIKSPCLLIVGDADYGLAGVQKCAEQMPTATLVVLPGVGHVYGYVHSELLLPHIRAFLAEMDAAQS